MQCSIAKMLQFSSAAIPKPSSGIDIYLGNLDESVTAELLKNEIKKRYNGEFGGPRIIFNKIERKSLGYGYMTVPTIEDANLVITQLNGLELNSKAIKVDIGQERRIFRAAFIGNLDPSVTEDELKLFLESKIGTNVITKIQLSKDPANTGGSRGFAHVDFKESALRDKALADLNGIEFKGN